MSMLDQTAVAQDIGWTQGDPVALSGIVIGAASWTVPYLGGTGGRLLEVAGVDETRVDFSLVGSNGLSLVDYVVRSSNTVIATIAATVEPNGDDAVLTLTLPKVDSARVPVGEYDWRLQQVDGPTRMAGIAVVSWTAGDGATGANQVTTDDVFAWLRVPLPSADAIAVMQTVVDAVNAAAGRIYEAPSMTPDADYRLGLTMQAARIWGRKDSPGGVLSSDEFGVVRVSRFDSDIDKLMAPFRIWHIGAAGGPQRSTVWHGGQL